MLIQKPIPLLTGCLEPECLISSLMGLSESEIREADKARALALHHAADTPCMYSSSSPFVCSGSSYMSTMTSTSWWVGCAQSSQRQLKQLLPPIWKTK